MTKDEFISKHKAVQHDLTHLGFIPWGIVFSIELGLFGYALYLVVLLFQYFGTDAIRPIIYELIFCVLGLGAFVFADKVWRRKLNRSGLRCPSCHKWLGGDTGLSVLETGRCGSCGERIFEV
jgi:hypothetical protein